MEFCNRVEREGTGRFWGGNAGAKRSFAIGKARSQTPAEGSKFGNEGRRRPPQACWPDDLE